MTSGSVASARMYAVAPSATAAWDRLLRHVGAAAGVELVVVEHAFPASLPALLARADLGCAFMCGWPLALEDRDAGSGALRPVIAAPVPDAAWSAAAPVYRSEFVVAAGSRFATVADAFGQRFAFNALSSHSGVNLPRAHLAQWGDRAPLFSALVGPLTTPRRCIEAVLAGDAEITAVDSYALQLLIRHDPALTARLRVVGVTAASPIPPLVGATTLADADVLRLRAALVELHLTEIGRALLTDLCLLRFEAIDRSAYAATLAVAPHAHRDGYPVLR